MLKKRADRNEKFEPQLIELGAVLKSTAVYKLDNWLCYPTKGFAMNKRNYKECKQLQKFINEIKEKHNV